MVSGGAGQAMPQPSKAFKHTLNFEHMITLNYFNRIIHILKLNALLDFSSYTWHTVCLCRGSQNAEAMWERRMRHL